MPHEKLEFDDSSSTSSEAVILREENADPIDPILPETNNIFEFELDRLEDKPWLKAGADITDYFNYGFDENTWRIYCARQRETRESYGTASSFRKEDKSSRGRINDGQYSKYHNDYSKGIDRSDVNTRNNSKKYVNDIRNEKDRKYVDSRFNNSKNDEKKLYERRYERYEDSRGDNKVNDEKQTDRYDARTRKQHKYNDNREDERRKDQRFNSDRKYEDSRKESKFDERIRESKYKRDITNSKLDDEKIKESKYKRDIKNSKLDDESKRYNDEKRDTYKR